MNRVAEYLQHLGLDFKPAGSQLQMNCPNCDDQSGHLYICSTKGIGHCKKCGWSPNPYLLGIKVTSLDAAAIMSILEKFGLASTHKEKANAKKSAVMELSGADIRDAFDLERLMFANDRQVDQKALIKFRPKMHRHKPWSLIPAYNPSAPQQPCGWLRCFKGFLGCTDADRLIELADGRREKYPMVAGGKHGLLGVRWIMEEKPDTIIFCEGWRDALAAIAAGYHTTASTGGASKWDDSWLPLFANKIVYICFDADRSGFRAAHKAAARIYTIATKVLIVNLPYEPREHHGKDLHDYLITDKRDIAVLLQNATVFSPTPLVRTKSAELLSADSEINKKRKLFIADFSKCLDFPIDAIPKVLRPFIEKGAEAIQCPLDFIGVPLFTAMGAVIGRTHMLEVKPGWLESTALWAVVVGEPGTAKSPAMNLALKPLFGIQQKLAEEFVMQQDIYKVKGLRHKKAMKFWERDKDDSDNPPEEPEKPILRRIIVSDSTVEALAPIMRDNQKGLILVRDELSGWITSMNQYKGGKGADIQFYLTIWSRGSVIVDRKTEEEHISLPDTYLAVTGSCQPGVLIDLLNKERQQNGFASRLLISYPMEVQRKWVDSGVDESVIQPVEQLFIKLCKLEMCSDGDKQSPNVIRFSPEGLEAFKEVMNIHFKQKSKYQLSGPIVAHWAKMEGYIARMALIFHIIRQQSGEPISCKVDEESVFMAAALGDYFFAHVARLYGMIDESKVVSLCERVLRWAQKHEKGEIVPRDIISARIVKNVEEAIAVFDDLEAAGKGHWVDGGKHKFILIPTQQVSNSADKEMP